MADRHDTLSRDELEQMLRESRPENAARRQGYALVHVLAPESFEKARIPGSINIPKERIEEFERRFDKEKKIVVYCASPECPGSRQAAEALAQRGFQRVYEYEGGVSDWQEAGHNVEGTASST